MSDEEFNGFCPRSEAEWVARRALHRRPAGAEHIDDVTVVERRRTERGRWRERDNRARTVTAGDEYLLLVGRDGPNAANAAGAVEELPWRVHLEGSHRDE